MARFAGKITGTLFGLALAGPLGGAFGFVLGHLHDMREIAPRTAQKSALEQDYFPDFSMNARQKEIFATGVIVLGAKLAKIDGHVTREEVLAFRRVFRTRGAQMAEVGRLFDRARTSAQGYEPYAARLAAAFSSNPSILEEILVGLFFIARADSVRLSREELIFLHRVAVMFGFSQDAFERIARRAGVHFSSAPPPPKKSAAYDVLGLPVTASDKDVKRTYRALIRKHHPDMLLAKGLAADKIAQATQNMQRINAAYSEICKERNIK